MIEIIIPVLNEEKILKEKRDYFLWLKSRSRVIFVDGGSGDQTAVLAKEFGEVIVSGRGRARQMNAGAAKCSGKQFLFLHVDTFLNEESLSELENRSLKETISGCFTMRIVEKGFVFRVFEWLVNFRARQFGVIDGDLGMFVSRDVFERLGGFDRVKIMEDILFSKKLRGCGRAVVLKGKIFVSGRRWIEEGFLKTFWKYSLAYLRLWFGMVQTKVICCPK